MDGISLLSDQSVCIHALYNDVRVLAAQICVGLLRWWWSIASSLWGQARGLRCCLSLAQLAQPIFRVQPAPLRKINGAVGRWMEVQQVQTQWPSPGMPSRWHSINYLGGEKRKKEHAITFVCREDAAVRIYIEEKITRSLCTCILYRNLQSTFTGAHLVLIEPSWCIHSQSTLQDVIIFN